ncbi:MAG: hypothetical protein GY793_09990, partial [Proteobacteria bacterium]|nr:hypothetical protein [Pseudomonadota bacterium]
KTVGKAGAQSSEGGENAAAKPPIPQEKPEELISRLNVQDLKDNSPVPPKDGKPKDYLEKHKEEFFMEEMYSDVERNEGTKYHPYVDTKGNITTGAGDNVENYEEFKKRPWIRKNDGKPASEKEIKSAYDALQS